jgi:hypothetical protein
MMALQRSASGAESGHSNRSNPAHPEAEEQRLESLLVAGGVSPTTRAACSINSMRRASPIRQAQMQQAQESSAAEAAPRRSQAHEREASCAALEKQDQLLAGLLLGSPEFQRR